MERSDIRDVLAAETPAFAAKANNTGSQEGFRLMSPARPYDLARGIGPAARTRMDTAARTIHMRSYANGFMEAATNAFLDLNNWGVRTLGMGVIVDGRFDIADDELGGAAAFDAAFWLMGAAGSLEVNVARGVGARGVAAAEGVSVLGHYPGYVNTAQTIGARYFTCRLKFGQECLRRNNGPQTRDSWIGLLPVAIRFCYRRLHRRHEQEAGSRASLSTCRLVVTRSVRMGLECYRRCDDG